MEREIAHPFGWTAKSFEKVLSKLDDPGATRSGRRHDGHQLPGSCTKHLRERRMDQGKVITVQRLLRALVEDMLALAGNDA